MRSHPLGLTKSWLTSITTILIVVAFCGCRRKTAPPPDRTRGVTTQVVEVVARPRIARLTGEFRARIQSDLSFRIAGRIANRKVDVGDRVAAGDILASIDTLQQTADVTAAKAALRSAEATLQQALANVTRIEQLLPSKSASQVEFDDAKAAFLTAQGSINISKSNLATAESQLSFTDIKANAAGVIIARTAEVGQVVNAAQTVFTIAEDGEREAVFDVFQTHVPDRPLDDKIELTLVSNPAIKITGIIREIAPSIDPSTGTVRVKVTVPNPPPQMTLGSPVIGVARFRANDVVELPWTALSRQGDQAAVWIVDPNQNTVAEQKIDIESYASGMMLIKAGLKAGDVVVIEGSQLIRPGQKVKPIAGTIQ